MTVNRGVVASEGESVALPIEPGAHVNSPVSSK